MKNILKVFNFNLVVYINIKYVYTNSIKIIKLVQLIFIKSLAEPVDIYKYIIYNIDHLLFITYISNIFYI